MKIKFKNFTTKGKIVLLSGALVLVGGSGYAIGKNVNKNSKANGDTNTSVSTEATIDNTEVAVNDTVTSDLQKYYDEIDMIEDDVVAAINDGLSKGMYDYDLTDEMKDSIVKTYLDYYLLMNKEQISGTTYDILNQDKDMNSMEIINNSMIQEQLIQEQTIISEEETELDYNYLIKEEADKKFISDLAHTIASMRTAINNNDKEELDRLASHIIEVKNGIKEDNAEYSMLYNPMTIDLAIMLIDSADMLYNGEIITDDEDLAQIFNTSYVRCIKGEYVSALTDEQIDLLAEEFKIEGYQNMSREEILEAISNLNAKGVSEVSLRSNLRSVSKASIEEVISNTSMLECSEDYSYNNLIESISARVDLSLQVRPEKNHLDVLNENPYGANYYKEDNAFVPGTTTTTTVPESQVPEDAKVPTTEETKTSEGEKTNEIYLKAKAAGITDGSAAAAQTYASSYAGNASAMPTKSVGSAPSLDCQDYNKVYNYFYNLEWNNSRSSFITMEQNAIKENEQATTEFVPVENGEETIINETEPQDVPFEEDEEFIPVSMNNIKSELMAMREKIVSAYTYAYNDTLEEGVKKM